MFAVVVYFSLTGASETILFFIFALPTTSSETSSYSSIRLMKVMIS